MRLDQGGAEEVAEPLGQPDRAGNNGGAVVRSMKTSERVAMDVVRDIVEQRLRPGDKLPGEAAMLDRYTASRASVREALRLLEVQGLINLKPGPRGGPTVGTVDPHHLARTGALYFHLGGATYAELFDAHTRMEAVAAEMAATNPDREMVREAMEPFLDAAPPLESVEFRENTDDFHDTVHRLGENRVFALYARSLGKIVVEHVVGSMDPVELRGRILDEHRDIGRAIIDGDARAASELMRDHFESLVDFYRRNWPARLEALIEWR